MNVLVTAMGSATAISVARSLYEEDHRVIGTDILDEKEIAGSAFCYKFFSLPHARREKATYLTYLKQIIKKELVELVIPCSDIEAEVIAESMPMLNDTRAFFNCSEEYAIKIANDKLKTYEFFRNNDIPTPETMRGTEENLFKIDTSFIIKDRFGVGSKGFFESLDMFYADGGGFDSAGEYWIIQEELEGREFTVDILVLPQGTIAVVPRWRLEVRDGKSFKCITFKDAELISWCKFIAFNLGMVGIYNIQGFWSVEKGWKFTEINCRPSATLVATLHSGINMPCLLVNHIQGNKIEPIEYFKQVKILRFLYEVCINES